MKGPVLTTPRLVLRRWREADRGPFAALNADPRVAEFLGGPFSAEASDAMLARIESHFETHGFGWWAVEERATGLFLGACGLSIPAHPLPFQPCVEVGWRLARAAWGRGFATEAAREAVRFGFEELLLAELVSFTVPANVRSRRVMEKLGMARDLAGDFEHPALAEGHPLRRHVLYRLRNPR